MARYIFEAVLDNGQRMQSVDVEREAPPNPRTHAVCELRGHTMVQSVAAIDLATGEVVVDLPSYAWLARARRPAA